MCANVYVIFIINYYRHFQEKIIKEMFLKRESNLKVKFRKKEIFEILLLHLKSVFF